MIMQNIDNMKETKIALGTWAWGSGAFGGDAVYGVKTSEETLRPVFEAAAAARIALTPDEVARLETLADQSGIDTRGEWEHTME